jgi:hypothetical protein
MESVREAYRNKRRHRQNRCQQIGIHSEHYDQVNDMVTSVMAGAGAVQAQCYQSKC